MLKARVRGRKYPRRKGWREGINLCECESCHAVTVEIGGVCDHIVPERAVRLMSPGEDPHHKHNLAGLCRSCHAKKLAIERRLYVGDMHSYVQGMKGLGFTKERINKALVATGFGELP